MQNRNDKKRETKEESVDWVYSVLLSPQLGDSIKVLRPNRIEQSRSTLYVHILHPKKYLQILGGVLFLEGAPIKFFSCKSLSSFV